MISTAQYFVLVHAIAEPMQVSAGFKKEIDHAQTHGYS